MAHDTLWAWDTTNKVWVKVKTDSQGRLYTVAVIDKLNDIGDVSVPSPTDGYFVYWDDATSLWKCKSIDAVAVAAVEAAGLSLAAGKNIIIPNDGYIQLGVLTGAPRLFGGVAGEPYEVWIQPKEGNLLAELGLMPKGTSTQSLISLWNKSDYDNAGYFQLGVNATDAYLYGNKKGTGTAPTSLAVNMNLEPNQNNALDLGHASYKWKEAHVLACSLFPDIAGLKAVAITFIIDGGGSAITTGIKGDLEIPFACTINRVTMLASPSGSIVVDIWKQAYADFPPEDAQSITAAAPPTITTAEKSQDSTLTGWTTAIAAGDCLRFNVDSVTDIERVTISLKVTKA